MFPGFATVTDLEASAELLRARRFGVIEVVDGRFHQIQPRPWPKTVSAPEVWWSNWCRARPRPSTAQRATAGMRDRCRLFYNQPWGHGNFLALRYIESWPGTSFASCWLAVRLLDEIARIKHSDAILCDVANARISDRLLARWGWEPHLQQRWHRNFIKRFYGNYPPPLARSLTARPTLSPLGKPALCG